LRLQRKEAIKDIREILMGLKKETESLFYFIKREEDNHGS